MEARPHAPHSCRLHACITRAALQHVPLAAATTTATACQEQLSTPVSTGKAAVCVCDVNGMMTGEGGRLRRGFVLGCVGGGRLGGSGLRLICVGACDCICHCGVWCGHAGLLAAASTCSGGCMRACSTVRCVWQLCRCCVCTNAACSVLWCVFPLSTQARWQAMQHQLCVFRYDGLLQCCVICTSTTQQQEIGCVVYVCVSPPRL